MSISVSPTFSASNTRESGISCCTSALVVVLPAPWVPLSHTITGPNASAVRAYTGVGIHRRYVIPAQLYCHLASLQDRSLVPGSCHFPWSRSHGTGAGRGERLGGRARRPRPAVAAGTAGATARPPRPPLGRL